MSAAEVEKYEIWVKENGTRAIAERLVAQRQHLKHANNRRKAEIDNARRSAAEAARLREQVNVLSGAIDGALRRWWIDKPHTHPTHAHALGYLRSLLEAHHLLEPDDQFEAQVRLKRTDPAPSPPPQEET